MIKIEQLKQIYDAKIDFETYFSLLISSNSATYQFPDIDYTPYKLIGYVDFECKITKKGEELLARVGSVNTKKDVDFVKLHEKLQKELLALTGKKQIVGFGGVYFIPTKSELEEFLTRFWKKYPENKDIVKITKCLENHISNCVKKNSFAPAIKYYIFKQGTGSQLAGAYENFEDDIKEIKKEDKLINTKELF